MLRTRSYMVLLFAIIAMVLMSACGPASTSTDTANDPTKFDTTKSYSFDFYEAFATDPNKSALEALTKQYMDAHPKIKINLNAFDSYGTLQTKLNAAIAAKTPPAIAQVYENWAVQYQQHNNIVSLQPYISGQQNGLSDLSDFYPSLVNDGKINGTQYMLPFNKSDMVIYYNADALQQYNLSAPKSVDELLTDVTKVTKADGSQWGLSVTPDVDLWSILYKSFGGKDFVSKDGKSETFDQGANKTASLSSLGGLAPLVKAGAVHITNGYAWQNDFIAQKSVFVISTIASYPFLAKPIGSTFKFNEAPIPAGPGGQYTVLFGTNLSLFSGVDAGTRAAAWDYLKFLISAKANIDFVKGTGYMPIRKSAFNSKDLQTYYAEVPARKVGPQVIDHAFVASFEPGWQTCRTDIGSVFTGVLKGQQTPDAGLTIMAQKCNDDLTA
ncbi:ABC transporter substrate-binding protein [Tengunoibacter tsumagoiensis]|uniref:ABC transporter substrate-binding protein n=1 Tax=Tengunoibacter tsumagoiensis TaxID=2014871 RepID=A0A401ZXL8_9CHLR|nr:ABC transporter substrate-binding protein [Tengunoibacter tsumagoiensis]GCE11589.1 ABC transporter substrate-binding protein [Tengunoibacter tsumagoiensis]